MLLDIEARIGEQIERQPTHQVEKAGGPGKPPPHTTRPDGITQRGSMISRAIHKNPAIVAKIKAQARENEDIRRQDQQQDIRRQDQDHPAWQERTRITGARQKPWGGIPGVFCGLKKKYGDRVGTGSPDKGSGG